MSDYDISEVCPNCGGNEYTTRRPTAAVAFVHDRVCKECEARYTPPTPVWAGCVFIAIGVFLLTPVVLVLLWRIVQANFTIPGVGLGILGLLAIFQGMRALWRGGR